MKLKENNVLEELAAELLSELSPNGSVQLDNLFEAWKIEEKSKQKVNFSLALPPEMKRKILSDIGVTSYIEQPVSERHLPYINILDRLLKIGLKEISQLSQSELATLIWKEGRNLGLYEYELQQLTVVIPAWFRKIIRKKNIEISPLNIFEINSSEPVKQSSSVYFKGIVGKSEKMQSVFSCLERIGKSNLSILLKGESGTGKELIAHAIHRISKVSGNFIPVNCGALPDTVIESELFGHEKGSFTGADIQKKGYFEISDKGTMFLDEITETSLNTQVKLLRVLQEQQFFRVGGVKPINISTRIIAATNREITEMINTKQFRHDLYYRINEMTITLPPLRERQEDIPFLVEHFLKTFSVQNRKTVPVLSNAANDILLSYSWPGNIRELENALKRAVVMSDNKIMPDHLPDNILQHKNRRFVQPDISENTEQSLGQLVGIAEKNIIETMLQKYNNSVTDTSEALKVSRRTLQRKIKEYNIKK